jgi:hypothetical protein
LFAVNAYDVSSTPVHLPSSYPIARLWRDYPARKFKGVQLMATRGPKTIDPSPAEIKRRTAKIRAGWSERTHRLRAGWTVEAADKMDQWTAPMLHIGDNWVDSIEEDDYPYWSN